MGKRPYKDRYKDFSQEVQLLHKTLVKEFGQYICFCPGFNYHINANPHIEVNAFYHRSGPDYLLVIDTEHEDPEKLTEVDLYTPASDPKDLPILQPQLSWADPAFFDKIKDHLRKYIKIEKKRKHDRSSNKARTTQT